jgi:hypothetical protein
MRPTDPAKINLDRNSRLFAIKPTTGELMVTPRTCNENNKPISKPLALNPKKATIGMMKLTKKKPKELYLTFSSNLIKLSSKLALVIYYPLFNHFAFKALLLEITRVTLSHHGDFLVNAFNLL